MPTGNEGPSGSDPEGLGLPLVFLNEGQRRSYRDHAGSEAIPPVLPDDVTYEPVGASFTFYMVLEGGHKGKARPNGKESS